MIIPMIFIVEKNWWSSQWYPMDNMDIKGHDFFPFKSMKNWIFPDFSMESNGILMGYLTNQQDFSRFFHIFPYFSNSQWLVPWEEVQRNPLQRSKTTGFAAGNWPREGVPQNAWFAMENPQKNPEKHGWFGVTPILRKPPLFSWILQSYGILHDFHGLSSLFVPSMSEPSQVLTSACFISLKGPKVFPVWSSTSPNFGDRADRADRALDGLAFHVGDANEEEICWDACVNNSPGAAFRKRRGRRGGTVPRQSGPPSLLPRRWGGFPTWLAVVPAFVVNVQELPRTRGQTTVHCVFCGSFLDYLYLESIHIYTMYYSNPREYNHSMILLTPGLKGWNDNCPSWTFPWKSWQKPFTRRFFAFSHGPLWMFDVWISTMAVRYLYGGFRFVIGVPPVTIYRFDGFSMKPS